jgi:hypothetical protein
LRPFRPYSGEGISEQQNSRGRRSSPRLSSGQGPCMAACSERPFTCPSPHSQAGAGGAAVSPGFSISWAGYTSGVSAREGSCWWSTRMVTQRSPPCSSSTGRRWSGSQRVQSHPTAYSFPQQRQQKQIYQPEQQPDIQPLSPQQLAAPAQLTQQPVLTQSSACQGHKRPTPQTALVRGHTLFWYQQRQTPSSSHQLGNSALLRGSGQPYSS